MNIIIIIIIIVASTATTSLLNFLQHREVQTLWNFNIFQANIRWVERESNGEAEFRFHE